MLQEIKEVFSKQYQEDVKQLEFERSMRQYVKLNNESESIDDKIDRLRAMDFVSDCHIEVGDFS